MFLLFKVILCQYTVTEWSGGLYVSPTIAGSRPGSLVAGAWAAMLSLGQEGGIIKFSFIISSPLFTTFLVK